MVSFSVTEAHLTEVDRQVARYRQTFDARELWPDSNPAERAAAYRDIRAATAAVLEDRRAALSTTGANARELGIAAFLSGMGPLLAVWVRQGRVAAHPAVADILGEHLAHARSRRRRIEEALARLIPALEARQAAPVVLKGAYTGHRYFPDPDARPLADIDLLIRPGHAAAAAEVLSAEGYRMISFHGRPFREDWAPAEQHVRSVELGHEDNPWGIDLHLSLDRSYFRGLTAGLGVPATEMLEPWDSPFGRVRVLRQPWLTAHLAINTASDFPEVPLVRVVELLWVIRQDQAASRFRWSELGTVLRETGTGRFAFPAFELLERLVPGSVDSALRGELAAAATSRLRRAVRDTPDRLPYDAPRQSLRLRFMWSRGMGQVIRNLGDLVFPVGPAITPRTRLRIWRRRLELLLTGRFSWKGT